MEGVDHSGYFPTAVREIVRVPYEVLSPVHNNKKKQKQLHSELWKSSIMVINGHASFCILGDPEIFVRLDLTMSWGIYWCILTWWSQLARDQKGNGLVYRREEIMKRKLILSSPYHLLWRLQGVNFFLSTNKVYYYGFFFRFRSKKCRWCMSKSYKSHKTLHSGTVWRSYTRKTVAYIIQSSSKRILVHLKHKSWHLGLWYVTTGGISLGLLPNTEYLWSTTANWERIKHRNTQWRSNDSTRIVFCRKQSSEIRTWTPSRSSRPVFVSPWHL